MGKRYATVQHVAPGRRLCSFRLGAGAVKWRCGGGVAWCGNWRTTQKQRALTGDLGRNCEAGMSWEMSDKRDRVVALVVRQMDNKAIICDGAPDGHR